MGQFIFNDCEVKKVVFGYGAVRGEVLWQELRLFEIKPPVGAGTIILDSNYNKVGDWEDTGKYISLTFNSLDEVKECEHWLDQIEAGNLKSFVFKDVLFDYTTFHESGLYLMREALKRISAALYILLAS